MIPGARLWRYTAGVFEVPENKVARLIGQVLGEHYHIRECLGRGGMGCVFRAWHMHLEHWVAVKVLSGEQSDAASMAEFQRRFRREAQVASRLSHPHIARVLDFGVDRDLPFMVMDLIEGQDLAALIRCEAPLAVPRALEIMQQLFSALAAAADQRIIHRDIKPSNIRLLGYAPAAGASAIDLRVLDFGLAKRWDDEEPLTASGVLMGTCAYMAPEQISCREVERLFARRRGVVAPDTARAPAKAPVDARADLYAAGILFYELLTGRPPFVGPPAALVYAHLHTPPPPLPASVAGAVATLVEQLLRKHPDERPESAAAVLATLRVLCGEDRHALSPRPRSQEHGRGLTRARALGLFALVVLVLGLATLTFRARDWRVLTARPGKAQHASSPPAPSPSVAATRAGAAPAALDDARTAAAPPVALPSVARAAGARAATRPAFGAVSRRAPPRVSERSQPAAAAASSVAPEYWSEPGPDGLPVLHFGVRPQGALPSPAPAPSAPTDSAAGSGAL